MTSITKVKNTRRFIQFKKFLFISVAKAVRSFLLLLFLLFYESINSKLVPYLNTNLDINVARTESGYIFC